LEPEKIHLKKKAIFLTTGRKFSSKKIAKSFLILGRDSSPERTAQKNVSTLIVRNTQLFSRILKRRKKYSFLLTERSEVADVTPVVLQ